MSDKLVGEVKWFSNDKGFGFIYLMANSGVVDMSKEYFVHYSNIDMGGYKTLKAKQKVIFELKKDDKGMQAINVKTI